MIWFKFHWNLCFDSSFTLSFRSTRWMPWLLMPWLLSRQVLHNHGISFRSFTYHEGFKCTHRAIILQNTTHIVHEYTREIMPHENSFTWCHQMETFSALLAICAGNSPVTSEFPAQRPVTWGFDVFFDLRLNKPLSKQWWGWWFETLSRPLWRHGNENLILTPK